VLDAAGFAPGERPRQLFRRPLRRLRRLQRSDPVDVGE